MTTIALAAAGILLAVILAGFLHGCTTRFSGDFQSRTVRYDVIIDPAWLTYTRQDRDPNGATTTIIYTPATRPATQPTTP